MKKIVVCIALCCTCIMIWAVPATPFMVEKQQPDGSVLPVRLCGDEYGHYVVTGDGYMVAMNPNDDTWEYMMFDSVSGTAVLSGVVAHDAIHRTASESAFVRHLPLGSMLWHAGTVASDSQIRRRAMQQSIHAKRYPLRNSPHSLVILVNFADKRFVVNNPRQAYTDLLNESGYSVNGGTGSARDYFIASSDSLFSPVFDVYGPYTLPENTAYYGSTDAGAAVMVKQAVSLACEAGVDLSQYDTDGDGVIDNVFVYYAGYNEAEGGPAETIWPHRYVVQNSPTYCGVRIYDYACTSELRGYSGAAMCGIGTFCHEFGHVLGLPDLYDTENSRAYTVGEWDIMSSGSYNNNGRTPPSYSAYERFFLDWLTPVQIDKAGVYMLNPLTATNEAFLLAAASHNLVGSTPNPTEFFLLENRQHVGWDAGTSALIGTGMLVWHITYNASRWSQNKPNNGGVLGVDIVEAYNQNPTLSSASDTYPGTRSITTLTPILSSGEKLDYPISNICQLDDGTITFALKGGDGSGFSFVPTTLPEFVSTYETENYVPHVECAIHEVLLLGNKLDPLETVEISLRNNFQVSLDSMASWTTTANLNVLSDSTLSRRLWLRYVPTRQNCSALSGSLMVHNTTYSNTLALSGRAPNPQHIVTPTDSVDSIATTTITPYSFCVQWTPQIDATAYYLTLYRIDNQRSEVRQGFENFTTMDNIKNEGWTANFVSPTTVTKNEGVRAVMFSETGHTLTSERYEVAAATLSFWLSATYTGNGDTIGGMMILTAFNGTDWQIVDSIDVKKTTKNLTKSYKFDEESNYIQFCFLYRHKAGNGGVALDNFIASFDKQITYLFRNQEKAFFVDTEQTPAAPASFYIKGLEPGQTYYYKLQCTDVGKGCEEHITDLSQSYQVTTLNGELPDSKCLTVVNEGGRYVVYIPEALTNRCIYIYTLDGLLVDVIPIETPSQNRIELPVLYKNAMYILKYAEKGEQKRKNQQWTKLLYQ